MKRILLVLLFACSIHGMNYDKAFKALQVQWKYEDALFELTETDENGNTFAWEDYLNYRHYSKYGALSAVITRYKEAIIVQADSDGLPKKDIGVAKDRLNKDGRKLFYVLTGQEGGTISSEEWSKEWTKIKNELLKGKNGK